MEHPAAGDDAARAHDRIHRHAHAPAFLRENELGRRLLGRLGADRPAMVVEIKLRNYVHQVHVGFVIGVQRAHVAPVARCLAVDVAEIVGHHARLLQLPRDDVLAEIVARTGILCVLANRPQQRLRVEDVNAHRGADHRGVEPRPPRVAVLRLLLEPHHAAVLANLHHPETARFLRRGLDGSDGDLRPVRPVPVQHFAVVHLVDVVAGEHQRLLQRFHLHALQVLEHGVGCTLVPVLSHALHGRNHFDVFAQFRGEDVPAVANVPREIQRFILC